MSNLIAEHTLPTGQTVRLLHGDLTEENVDAIINAANAQLAHGGGVASAIVRRGGKQIQTESNAWVREHGPVSHERPAITSAGLLPSEYVIHVVGPKWGEGDEDAKLRAAVTGGLALAVERGTKSIALPAISTGIFGFPKDRAAKIILDAVVDFFSVSAETSLQDVRLTLIDEPSVLVFAEEFERRWPGSVNRP